MLQVSPNIDHFKQQLRGSLETVTQNTRTLRICKNDNIFTCGDESKCVYFIVSGQVKLLMTTPKGKECILGVYTAGDVFGEMCLSGFGPHKTTANAMDETVMKEIPGPKLLKRLVDDKLVDGFVKYLAERISEQQDTIMNLVTMDSEKRLGRVLLQLAKTLGEQGSQSIRIDLWISHEELAAMVGTTRPRITEFMGRFQQLGLIAVGKSRFINVETQMLIAYLDRAA